MLPPAPIRALVIDPDSQTRKRLRDVLLANQCVDAVHEAESIKQAIDLLGDTLVNAIFIDPLELGLAAAADFIFNVRRSIPHIVFCLYAERAEIERQASQFYHGERQRFNHYYSLDKDLDDDALSKETHRVVAFCISDVRVFAEMERMRIQRSFYLESLPPDTLNTSLKKFRRQFPPRARIAFIMMRFEDGRVHKKISELIKETLKQFDIIGVRADEFDFHETLLHNVQTYVHGCDFGIAVFERVKDDTFNPNVAYEVGYLTALRKPVCILKDKTLNALPSDLLGALYVEFDTSELRKSIKSALRQWIARQAFGGTPPKP